MNSTRLKNLMEKSYLESIHYCYLTIKKHFPAQKIYKGNFCHFWSTLPCIYRCVNEKPNHVHFTRTTNHPFEPTKVLLPKYFEFKNLFVSSFVFFLPFSNKLDVNNVFRFKG
jgi:hypothetical protein